MREPSSMVVSLQRAQRMYSMASFFVRAKSLQCLRTVHNVFSMSPRLDKGTVDDFPVVLAESISILHTTDEPNERLLMLGKIENLRMACQKIDKRILRAGETFSLWRQIGPPWRIRGFAVGREVREGCIVPTVGGGLCQFSGALMELASKLGFKIIERHRHTALPPDVRYIEQRDATLFWNYVDLRFSATHDVLFEAHLTERMLVVRVRANSMAAQQTMSQEMLDVGQQKPRELPAYVASSTSRKVAYLLGDPQPEFTRYVKSLRKGNDTIFVSFNAPFDVPGMERVKSPPLYRVRRAIALRWAVARKKTVAKTHFALAETVANYYAKHLHYSVDHVCVAQTLLPYLWRSGKLQGRSFDVMMYRAPTEIIESELESAVGTYSHSTTLREFRAPGWFIDAEREALAAARTVITPHAYIASLFENVVELSWDCEGSPENAYGNEKRDLIVFLGPTLARKGCYAVRDAIKELGVPLTIVGSEPEGPDFWKGLTVSRCDIETLPWARVHTVVQPALFEYWPRQLLRARRAGARLLITPGCGIREDERNGIWHVPFGDADALVTALRKSLELRE